MNNTVINNIECSENTFIYLCKRSSFILCELVNTLSDKVSTTNALLDRV